VFLTIEIRAYSRLRGGKAEQKEKGEERKGKEI
jgi:hypothetical protein